MNSVHDIQFNDDGTSDVTVRRFPTGHLETFYNMPIAESEWHAWCDSNMLIQDAFPRLDAGQRELLLSGMTGEEFDKMFEDA